MTVNEGRSPEVAGSVSPEGVGADDPSAGSLAEPIELIRCRADWRRPDAYWRCAKRAGHRGRHRLVQAEPPATLASAGRPAADRAPDARRAVEIESGSAGSAS